MLVLTWLNDEEKTSGFSGLPKVEVDKAGTGKFGHPPPSWVQAVHAVVEAFLEEKKNMSYS
jgi:hypothetical protein